VRQSAAEIHHGYPNIIISHSMGGLVTRHALAGEGGGAVAAKVLGVVHGAQPVHGAPDAYHRAIAGTGAEGLLGRITSEVLGPDGPHIPIQPPAHDPAFQQRQA
jgi:alpha-beta hydrolase superfamily lysophospholipase